MNPFRFAVTWWFPFGLHDGLRCAGHHQMSAFRTCFGAHVDHPVGRFDDVEVVFDHQHAVPYIHEPLHDFQQLG